MASAKRIRRRWGRTGAFATVGMLAMLAACDDAPTALEEAGPVFTVRIEPAAVVMDEMATADLRAVIVDREGRPVSSAVTWTSDDEAIAKIASDGTVTGMSGGLVIVRAKVGDREGRAHVQVEEVPHAIEFDVPELNVVRATMVPLAARVVCMAGHVVDRTIAWSVSDESVALVSEDGIVTGVTPGEVEVTARAVGLTAKIPVRVFEPVQHIALNTSRTRLRIAETVRVEARLTGMTGPVDAPVTWTTSDAAVVDVDQTGLVNAVGRGSAIVTAAAGNRSATIPFTVEATIARLAIAAPDGPFVVIGHATALEVDAVDAAGEPVTVSPVWSTSDPSVATVDADGNVLGVSAGTVTVAAAADGLESSIELSTEPVAASLVLGAAVVTLPLGTRTTLSASATGGNGEQLHRRYRWTSSHPEIVGVDDAGDIVAWQLGTAVITATAVDISQGVQVRVEPYVGSFVIEAAVDTITVGGTVTLTAVGRDGMGRPTPPQSVTWTSGDSDIIEVDALGVATGKGEGSTVVTATSGGLTAKTTLTVLPAGSTGPPHRIGVSPTSVQAHPGGTTQIVATPRDANGNAVGNISLVWTSDDPTIAEVDQSGLVTGVATGATTIHVSGGGMTTSVPVAITEPGGGSGGGSGGGGGGTPGGGGGDEGLGNNLSNPVVFADGYGLTGLAVATDPGVRPTADEGITVTGTSAFFYSGNHPDYMGTYYLQKTENTWRAEWADGSGTTQNVDVDWGDNLMSHTFNTHAPIRVEVVLFSQTVPSLTGFNMTYISGSGADEVQGTDGSTALLTPTVYTVVPRLTIQKLDSITMQPIPGAIAFDGTVADGLATEGPGTFGAEVNVSGKVIYGYNFFIPDVTLPGSEHKYGWWRITFSLEAAASIGGTTVYNNVRLVSLLDPGAIYTPVLDPSGTSTSIDIHVDKAQGGGGGGGGHTTTGGSLP